MSIWEIDIGDRYGRSIWEIDMGDDSIGMVISHIDMGSLVTLLPGVAIRVRGPLLTGSVLEVLF
jgi:hypothetical protein